MGLVEKGLIFHRDKMEKYTPGPLKEGYVLEDKEAEPGRARSLGDVGAQVTGG